MATSTVTPFRTAGKQAVAELEPRALPRSLGSVIEWNTAADVGMLQSFVNDPPLHSVVITFSPAAAEQVLKVTNNHNRKIARGNLNYIKDAIHDETFELTGDTVKFSESGTLLDGQHRLQACVNENHDLTTHVIFGLKDEVFDLLDQGRKRTPGDILHVAGFKEPNTLASGIRWAKAFANAETPQHLKIRPREMIKLLKGQYKGLADWVAEGRTINAHFKHSPSMIAALLYTIGKQNKALAAKFANDWIHGGRAPGTVGYNFDVLQRRVMERSNDAGGRMNHYERAALIVQVFNAWNAGVVLAPAELKWKVSWKFPRIHTSAEAYKAELEAREVFQGLSDNQRLCVMALETKLNPDTKRATVSLADLAAICELKTGVISLLIKQLAERGLVRIVSMAEDKDNPSVFILPRAPKD